MPYIRIRHGTRKLVYKYKKPKLDIQGPLIDLINSYYFVDSDLFGNYEEHYNRFSHKYAKNHRNHIVQLAEALDIENPFLDLKDDEFELQK